MKKSQKTIFGTCGIRRRFTVDFSGPQWLEIGMAIGTYLGKGSMVLVGRDTRQTAELVQYALISGLISCGCSVKVLNGSAESPYVTTSTIAYTTKHVGADAGIQVTASHNTPDYIGIKIWQNSGMGFTPAQEAAIDEIYSQKNFRLSNWDEIQKVTGISNANDIHLQAILERINAPLKFKRGKFTVAVDPGNGAACEIAPRLLQKLGVNVVSINAQPDGLFPGRDSEPTKENIRTLMRMVKNDPDIHLGIAFDGDADRVRFICGKGNLLDADRVLLLLAVKLSEMGKIKSPYVVTPVNSSRILEKTLKMHGMKVSRTRIGDINVAMRMQEVNATIGGEISGTYTWPEFHLGPDSLYTTARVLELVGMKGMIEDLMDEIPTLEVIRKKIEISEELHSNLDMDNLENQLRMLLDENGIKIEETTHLDGISFLLEDGFILVRLSGTSPLIRVTCERETGEKANNLVELVERFLIDKMN
ncbi:MAG: phosphoglucosamine mutase [Promethearchaeota archaeon]